MCTWEHGYALPARANNLTDYPIVASSPSAEQNKYRAVWKCRRLLECFHQRRAALLTPAQPGMPQHGNNHIDWLFKEGRKMFWLQLSKRRVPEGIRAGRAEQAAVAAVLYPEERLVSPDCACSFGSVISPSALQSKKAFSLPGARTRPLCFTWLAVFHQPG